MFFARVNLFLGPLQSRGIPRPLHGLFLSRLLGLLLTLFEPFRHLMLSRRHVAGAATGTTATAEDGAKLSSGETSTAPFSSPFAGDSFSVATSAGVADTGFPDNAATAALAAARRSAADSMEVPKSSEVFPVW